jgi:release factor glutamine methyltransferase
MLKALNNHKDIFYLINKYRDCLSRIEVEELLSYIFKCRKEKFYITDIAVGEEMESFYDSLVTRRLKGEPLQYIIGTAEFMGLNFIVNRDVFIPRPETEILVNTILSSPFTFYPSPERRLKILDLCTGCGNIAISLAKFLPDGEIIATDISSAALNIAEQNSVLNEVNYRIKFYQGNLFQALPFDKKYKFDIIVCNPPYIKHSDIEHLQKEVRREPRISLDGGEDGLDFYRRIAGKTRNYLKKGGALFLEIGAGQVADVIRIFESMNIFNVHKIIKDFTGIERVLWIGLY